MQKLHYAHRGWGVALLTVLGSAPLAQQALRAVHPDRQGVIQSVRATWSELLEIQASLRPVTLESRATSLALELPVEEISLAPRGKRALPTDPEGGIERVGSCTGFTSEPPIGFGMDSQLDVPDGAGFSFIPPDVAGGVGPAHLMTMLENRVLITDRLGGSPVVVDTSVFWTPLGATSASPTTVYPRVYFDDLSGRWMASIRNGIGSTGSTSVFFAISQTDDPTGTWDYYSFLGDPTSTSQVDWLQLGYNDTWIVLTANMLNLAGTGLLGVKIWAIDKATALVPGGPITVSTFPTGITTTVHGSGGSSLMPARTLDSDPTLWFVNTTFTSSGNFLAQLTRMTGTGPAPVVSGIPGSPFGGNTSFCFLSTNFSSTQPSMAQLGDARFISPFSTRVASVAVRNGKIWMAQSGGLPGPSTNTTPTANGVVWQQIDPTLPFPGAPAAPGTMVLQSGAITNGVNTMSMYPSIAVNCADDVLIGYANGDATRDPRACYSFRLGTDPLNFMGAVNELKAGESSYWKVLGVEATAPYGRYTSTCVDPNDDMTMWTLQQYADMRVGPADNDSRWGTCWGRFGDCEMPPFITDQPDPVAICVGDPATFTVVASSSGPLGYQWRKDGVDILGANSSSYSIPAAVAADAGAYDVVVCDCGEVTSQPAVLSIGGPRIWIQPADVRQWRGSSATFVVVAEASLGSLTYQWRHNGSVLPLETGFVLQIESLTASDLGDYDVVVADDCGLRYSSVARLELRKWVAHVRPDDLFTDTFTRLKMDLDTAIGKPFFNCNGPDALAAKNEMINARDLLVSALGVFGGLSKVQKKLINLLAHDDLAELQAQLPILEAAIAQLPNCHARANPADVCSSIQNLWNGMFYGSVICYIVGGIMHSVAPGSGTFLFGVATGLLAAGLALNLVWQAQC